jgi:HK97 family phage portal protein
MQNSAVWAALRLRADLISTMPINAYRNVVIDPGSAPSQIEANTAGIMNDPEFMAWLYASQVELDRSGNSIGIIREVDVANYPTKIDLQSSSDVNIRVQDGEIVNYRIRNTDYKPEEIWHERQYVISGSPIGLSPVAYAAWTLGEYRSVEQFVTNWFMSGQTPRARLKNAEKQLDPKEALAVKEAWRASQTMGEPFVHGNDWEYDLVQAQQASADWLEAKRYGAVDISRFFNVPAELIDANVSGQSVTYANLSDRNLQLLVFHLGPALARRENALSRLLPRPRYVKFDADSILRMDPKNRAEWIKLQIDSRVLAPSEARAMANRKPFTNDQIAEFEELGLNKTATGALIGAANLPVTPAPPPAEPTPAPVPPPALKGKK